MAITKPNQTYTYFQSYTVSSSEELVNTLDYIESSVYNNHLSTFKITLPTGTFVLKKRYEFHCNLILQGTSQGTLQSIISIDPDTFLSTTNDHAFAVVGKDRDTQVAFEMRNIYVKMNTQKKLTEEQILIKLSRCNRIIIKDVRSELNNGKITNFVIRSSSNITIENCNLINYNYFETKTIQGGIIWITGECSDVNIIGNSFVKHGTDEAIAFYSSAEYSDKPFGRVRPVVRRNISIVGNKFDYGNNKNITKGEETCCDKLIVFSDAAGGLTLYENVTVSNNKFIISDLIKRVISIQNISNFIGLDNFRIQGNEIEHDYTVTYNAFAADLTVSCNQKPNYNLGAILFTDNIIKIRGSLKEGNGHIIIDRHAGNIVVERNTIDAYSFKIDVPSSSGQPKGIIGFIASKFGGNLIFNENNITYLGVVGQILSASNSDEKLNLYMNNNYMYGATNIYCQTNCMRTELRVTDNFFRSNSRILLIHGFSQKGSITVCGNTWEAVVANGVSSGTLYEANSTSSSANLEWVIIKSNAFFGTRKQINYTTLPKSNSNLNTGNSAS